MTHISWSQTNQIELVHSDVLSNSEKIEDAVKLTGNVHFKNQNLNLFCDSALFHQTQNWVKGYGRVQINQGDTLNLYSDSLFFDGNTSIGKLQSNVKIRDNSFKLNTDSLSFNTMSSVAYYSKNAFIKSNLDEMTLTSTKGKYFAKTKTFIFKDSVILEHPDYIVHSDTLEYRALDEDILIHGPSTIWLDSATILTEKAIYHTQTDDMQLWRKAIVKTQSQTIKGDSLWFNGETENARGFGNIFIQDTIEKVDFIGDFFLKTDSITKMNGNAQVFQYQKTDTLVIQADTILQLTSPLTNQSIQIAQSNVILEQGELIGVCDSLLYSQRDSIIKMQKSPIVWRTNTELTADSIEVKIADKVVKALNLYQKAFVSMEHDSLHYDQCSGKLIFVKLDSNAIKTINIIDNAETIYFPSEEVLDTITNEKNKTLKGVNYMLSNSITLQFENSEVQKISFKDKPEAVFKPLETAKKEDFFLKKFNLKKSKKPDSILKNLNYFSATPKPQAP
ncbi:MAG: OstA-like protein [Crocinitomicaceae bacterium]